jgi:hypothetical protein
MDADGRIVGVDALISFPLCPSDDPPRYSIRRDDRETRQRRCLGNGRSDQSRAGSGSKHRPDAQLQGLDGSGEWNSSQPSSSFLEFLGEDLARYGQRSGSDASTVVRFMAE